MPYIKQSQRDDWKIILYDLINQLNDVKMIHPEDFAGNLNYVFSKTLKEVATKRNVAFKPGYRFYNEIMGVLDCVKMEFYRRYVAPYEDTKIKENGDI